MADQSILPVTIVGKADVVRLKHQVSGLDEMLHQQRIKKQEQASRMPDIQPVVMEAAQALGFDVLDNAQRGKLLEKLESITTDSPVIHISFAVTPKPAFLQKITSWFRTEIHPSALIQVGLQPSIAAGCIVRTPNKQFDFSLRQFLQTKQELLVNSVRGDQ